jgi:AraC-like DNA-binding protein
LLNEVRRELAMRYLANPALSMVEVSRLLGYGQPSSFSRWFAAEFGGPPTHARAPAGTSETNHAGPIRRRAAISPV